ncbi:MAG TPA: hypothetical protein VG075_04825 [Candidatus Acidoferrum sp.]|jgi:hypothetical protein|nr:hypothetical protein [Candidatus Acidoferrum sp.]
MLPTIGNKTAALLRNLLPSFNPTIEAVEPVSGSRDATARLDLPTAPGAEYSFALWFGESGDREISAVLTPRRNERPYFWYRPFELAEFGNNVEKLETKFCDELEILLTHETRVIQRKGWLFWGFRCEYHEAEDWKRVYGHLALRWFKSPQIKGKRRVYSSAPVSSVVKLPAM